jgi:hypothetical protein
MDVIGGVTRKSSDHFVIFFALILLLILKEKRKNKFEKESESEVKRKALIFTDCAFLFSRQEHRIIEPDMGGVANNHLTK